MRHAIYPIAPAVSSVRVVGHVKIPLKGASRRACEHNAQKICATRASAAHRAAASTGGPADRPHILRSCSMPAAASEDARCKARRSAAVSNARPPTSQCSFTRPCALPQHRFAPTLVASLRALRATPRSAHAACSPRAASAQAPMTAPSRPLQARPRSMVTASSTLPSDCGSERLKEEAP